MINLTDEVRSLFLTSDKVDVACLFTRFTEMRSLLKQPFVRFMRTKWKLEQA